MIAAIMVLSMGIPALADVGDDAKSGTITITNATKDETYAAFKLFDVTTGNPYEKDGETITPTGYVATESQKAILEDLVDNVFEFTRLKDGTYQVTVKQGVNEEAVIAFLNTFVTKVGSTVACSFPDAVRVGMQKAESNTVTFTGLDQGYYFVTSSLGSVVTIDTANPRADIIDKNPEIPDYDNEPEPEEPDNPVKDVKSTTERDGGYVSTGSSIDGKEVQVGQVLSYEISYVNDSEKELDEAVIEDAPPEGTEYIGGSAAGRITGADGSETPLGAGNITVADNGDITWRFEKIASGAMITVSFQVEVTEDALTIDDKTVENEADVTVKIGENTYDLKTNTVENPVDDPDDPVKDVKKTTDNGDGTYETGSSIDGQKVKVGDILTYEISYTNHMEDTLDTAVVKDAPPTGTVYVDNSAAGRVTGADGKKIKDLDDEKISIDQAGNITWNFEKVNPEETITVSFRVKVTEAAQTIIDRTIVNDADVDVTVGENKWDLKTNTVTNPVEPDEPDEPQDPNPGKVIVNADGSKTTVSTGAFGETVTFDVGINAVNSVEQDGKVTQVRKYYIYDKLDPGFTLDAGSMKMQINGEKYAVVADSPSASEKSSTYTIYDGDQMIGTMFTAGLEDGCTLITATIDWVKEEGGQWTALYPNCQIHLIYDAVINENATIAGTGNVNRVRYDYATVEDEEPEEPDPDEPKYPTDEDLNHGSEEKTTVTYTYALGIQKYSAETGEALEGAYFSAVDAGENPIYAVKVEDGLYNYSASAKEGTTNEFVTDGNGQIIIKGVDIGTYTFRETKAPDGYTLLKEEVSVEAKMDGKTEETTVNKTEWTVKRYFEGITAEEFDSYTGDVYKKDSGTDKYEKITKPDEWAADTYYKMVGKEEGSSTSVSEGSTSITFDINVALLEVENTAGSLLPSTGGIGTMIFYVIGGILVVAAGVLLVSRRRIRSEK